MQDGRDFHVHRIVMAAASSYFMLRVDSEIASGQMHVLKGTCVRRLPVEIPYVDSV